MNRRALTGLVLVASLLFGAVAAGGAAHAQRRAFCGRVRARPRACLIVSGGIGARAEFDISDARPHPRPDMLIAGSGLDRGLSRCLRADRRLTAITWRRVTACPMPR